jgi:hypothetical protein
MDEIDLHLNTKLQFDFLKELTENWIQNSAQFWTASHSLGFIKYAMESQNAIIIDLDNYDFDQSKILTPEPKQNPDLYEIAIDKNILSSLFHGYSIVFVENQDKDFYASLNIKDTIFVSENDRNGVYHKCKKGSYFGLVDRDFLTDEDINLIELEYRNLGILRYYSVENYLYHPENLNEYFNSIGKDFNIDNYVSDIIVSKNRVKDDLILSISLKRTEYPYFKEPGFNKTPKQDRFKNKSDNLAQSTIISKYLNSDLLEDFYKVFPMKSYGTEIPQRQHISKIELSKTKWFKQKISDLIRKS